MKIYLHLAEGFEEIEAVSVVDVLRRADMDVETVSISGKKEVIGAHNIILVADKLFEEINYDQGTMIVLPGGMPGTTNLENHVGLTEKIKAYARQDKWLAAICAAPMILGRLGILNDKSATCYPGFEKELIGANYLASVSVVQSGKIITSPGPGTAILFGLKIVEVLIGPNQAEAIRESMRVCPLR
ncbi:MAG: DJ-1/PfpI family protein [Desulfitobacteriaceae bacterium]|nr:DJ-1/PfpI family protein [Desulfitobacteriaceae bacterium]MDD4345824.1 DJ-1/PfpI family protein [Desulfitobacteriaceae bacterium]MDD4402614.1 DJ-1/PfpI family protein [Desulfitobacteriaceae bacterium]